MPKAPVEVTINNHLSKDELISKFRSGSAYTKIKANLHRAMIRYFKQKGLIDSNTLEAGYHYFVCPITGLRFCEVTNNHFKRFGVSKDRYLELFPEFEGITETPYSLSLRKEKSLAKKSSRPKDIIRIGNVEVDVNSVKDVITEKAYRERVRDLGVEPDDGVEDYHYFVCPVTKRKILGFTIAYFDKMKTFGILSDMLKEQYPECEFRNLTPSANGISLDEFMEYGHIKRSELREDQISSIRADDTYPTRYNHLSRDDLLLIIEHELDEVINQYITTRKYGLNRFHATLHRHGLTLETATEGYHFLVHPLTGIPCIKYELDFLDVFGINKARFDELFPEAVTQVAPWMTDRIRETGEIVDENGQTASQRSTQGRLAAMRVVDEDGRSLQEKTIEKTVSTHNSRIDEYGRNGYMRIADTARPKSMEGTITRESEFERYERMVEYLLNKIRPMLKSTGITFGRSTTNNLNDTNCHQVDHKYSIFQGYLNRISPLCIGHPDNLEILTARENFDKRDECSITINDLEEMNGMTLAEMNNEFERIMNVVRRQIQDEELATTMTTLIEAGHDIAIKVKPYNDFYREYSKDNE